jgi:oxygen-independent coproporphyrinogen-3 oxidase
MAGIYLHIPFCKKACHYCNFHFSTQTALMDVMVDAMCKELTLQKGYLGEPIQTIYFGGGTPSLLKKEHFEKLIHQIRTDYPIDALIEFTIEANPDDINVENLTFWNHIGVNRLSIGIQSFQPHALEWMNRAHSAEQSYQSILLAQQYGFSNISVDLIYGTPKMTIENLISDLDIIEQLQIPHVSCYALTIEEKTALHHFIKEKKMENVDPLIQETHFKIIVERLNKLGFVHYEISNFGKPSMFSKHNSNYWDGIPYLGIGPSAHSFNLQSRQWNVSNNALYIQSLEKNVVPFEIEKLTLQNQYNEFIMVGLRRIEGIDTSIIASKFGESFLEHTLQIVAEKRELLDVSNNQIAIKKECRFLADGIASDFFIV